MGVRGGGAGECEGKGEDEVISAWEQGQLRGRLLCLTFLADKGILVEVEKHMRRAAAGRLQRRRDGKGERRGFIRARSGCAAVPE